MVEESDRRLIETAQRSVAASTIPGLVMGKFHDLGWALYSTYHDDRNSYRGHTPSPRIDVNGVYLLLPLAGSGEEEFFTKIELMRSEEALRPQTLDGHPVSFISRMPNFGPGVQLVYAQNGSPTVEHIPLRGFHANQWIKPCTVDEKVYDAFAKSFDPEATHFSPSYLK